MHANCFNLMTVVIEPSHCQLTFFAVLFTLKLKRYSYFISFYYLVGVCGGVEWLCCSFFGGGPNRTSVVESARF
jgi:hypothetical protein